MTHPPTEPPRSHGRDRLFSWVVCLVIAGGFVWLGAYSFSEMRTTQRWPVDPTFDPFEDETWQALTEGIPTGMWTEFDSARSHEHAMDIRKRLQAKARSRQHWREYWDRNGDLIVTVAASTVGLGLLLIGTRAMLRPRIRLHGGDVEVSLRPRVRVPRVRVRCRDGD